MYLKIRLFTLVSDLNNREFLSIGIWASCGGLTLLPEKHYTIPESVSVVQMY